MSKDSSRNALLTSNVRLTDTDGKSGRLLHLVDLLDSAGFKVTLIVNECNSTTAKQFSIIQTKTGLRDTSFDNLLKKAFYHISQFIKLLSFYAKLLVLDANYEVVVSSLEGLQIDSLLVCTLSKIKKIPFVYDYDDPSPEILRAEWGRSHFGRRILVYLPLIAERFLCTSSSLTFVPNESMKQLISRSVNTSNVVVLYNTVSGSAGYDHCQYDVDKAQLGLPQHKMIISYVGLIRVRLYRIDDLLKLFSRIDLALKRKIQILLIGPQDTNILDVIHKLRLENNVWYLGCVERQKARSILKLSNLSIIPIPLWGEDIASPSTKFFESMSLGIPVLTTKTKEIQRILGQKYPYYYDYTPNGLGHVLRSALANQEMLKVVGEKMRKLFEEKYNWEHQKKELLHILSHAVQT